MAGTSFPDSPHRKGFSDRWALQLFICFGGASSFSRLHRQPEIEKSVTKNQIRERRHLHHQCILDTPRQESRELPGGFWEGVGEKGLAQQNRAPQNREALNRDEDTKMGWHWGLGVVTPLLQAGPELLLTVDM